MLISFTSLYGISRIFLTLLFLISILRTLYNLLLLVLLAPMEDQANPFFLHQADGPGMVLVSQVLTGDNYGSWSKAMIVALSVKNKLGFVDGSIQVFFSYHAKCDEKAISHRAAKLKYRKFPKRLENPDRNHLLLFHFLPIMFCYNTEDSYFKKF